MLYCHWLCLGVRGSFSDTDIDFLFWASLIFKFCSLFLLKYRIVFIYILFILPLPCPLYVLSLFVEFEFGYFLLQFLICFVLHFYSCHLETFRGFFHSIFVPSCFVFIFSLTEGFLIFLLVNMFLVKFSVLWIKIILFNLNSKLLWATHFFVFELVLSVLPFCSSICLIVLLFVLCLSAFSLSLHEVNLVPLFSCALPPVLFW